MIYNGNVFAKVNNINTIKLAASAGARRIILSIKFYSMLLIMIARDGLVRVQLKCSIL